MGSTVFCGVSRVRCRQGKSHADAMVVICLFSMLIYSPIKSPQSLIFFLQIEIKIIWWFFFFFHIAIHIAEKQNIAMRVFFQYRAALRHTHRCTHRRTHRRTEADTHAHTRADTQTQTHRHRHTDTHRHTHTDTLTGPLSVLRGPLTVWRQSVLHHSHESGVCPRTNTRQSAALLQDYDSWGALIMLAGFPHQQTHIIYK